MKKTLLATALFLGLSTSAYAAYQPLSTDGSIVTLPNGQNSVSGLINVLNYAPGTAINDGNTHTVGTAPVGNIFHGITTLAGLAALVIDGQTPFSFLTGSGATVGPMCTSGSTTNCFTNGVYNLTNSSVANMDLAWLAIQGALIAGKVYMPAGNYVIGSTEVLPLMINGSIASTVRGDGNNLTFLHAGHDFGAQPGDTARGIHLLACGDPAGNYVNGFGEYGVNCLSTMSDFHLIGPTGSEHFTIGTSPVAMDGMALARGETDYNIQSGGFYDDFTLSGSHMSYINLNANGGVRGLYYIHSNGDLGDNVFWQFAAGGSQAAIAVSPANAMQDYWMGETYINGPYAVFGESGCGQPIVSGAYIQHLMTEWVGDAVFHDDNVYSGGLGANSTGTYTAANKCRGVANIEIDHWYNSFNQGAQNNFWGQSGGRRRHATIDVSNLTGRISGMNDNGGTFFPIPDTVGSAMTGFIDTTNIGQGVGNLLLSGSLYALWAEATTDNLPVFVNDIAFSEQNGAAWEDPGANGGIFVSFIPEGNYTSTTAGDVLEQESGNFGAAVPGGFSATAPAQGIVQVTGATGGIVPVVTHGTMWASNVNTGYNNALQGFVKKSSGVGQVTFTAGSGATASGTFTVTATGGGCTTEPAYSVVVASGHITGVTSGTTPISAGCTSAPSITNANIVSAGATGLTGSTVTMQWPSAGVVSATGPTDGIVIGTVSGFTGGTNGNGTSTSAMKPMNLN